MRFILFITFLLLCQNIQAECAGRGLLTMGLLNKKFPIKDAAEVLDNSPCPAFGFLYRSFGENWENLQYTIDYLSHNNNSPSRPITVVIYVDCGPCRPPRRQPGLFRLISQGDWIDSLERKLRRKNGAVLDRFYRAALDINYNLPKAAGVHYIITPSLEDNFSNKAYRNLVERLRTAFQDRLDTSFSRNPRYRDNKPVKGDKLEIHSYDINDLKILSSGDILSGDGFIFCTDKERQYKCTYNINHIESLIKESMSKGVLFLLYRPEIQGISLFTEVQKKKPSQRTYKIPHKDILIDLMR